MWHTKFPEWEEAATLLQLWISFSITKKVCCFQIWNKVFSDFVIKMSILSEIFAPNPTTICMWRDSCLMAKADSPPEKGSGQTEPGLNGVLWFYQTRRRWWDCYNNWRKTTTTNSERCVLSPVHIKSNKHILHSMMLNSFVWQEEGDVRSLFKADSLHNQIPLCNRKGVGTRQVHVLQPGISTRQQQWAARL